MSYRDLITASVDLDFSALEERLDEFGEIVSQDDFNDLDSRVSSLESLNTCGVDINGLADLPDRVQAIEDNRDGIDFEAFNVLTERVDNLEDKTAEMGNQLAGAGEGMLARIESLEGKVREQNERILVLERYGNKSATIMDLLGQLLEAVLRRA